MPVDLQPSELAARDRAVLRHIGEQPEQALIFWIKKDLSPNAYERGKQIWAEVLAAGASVPSMINCAWYLWEFDRDDAVALLMKLDPDLHESANTLLGLHFLEQALGNREVDAQRAVFHLVKACEAHPASPMAYAWLQRAWILAGDEDRATEVRHECVPFVAIQRYWSAIARGRSALRASRWESVLQSMEEASSCEPSFPAGLVNAPDFSLCFAVAAHDRARSITYLENLHSGWGYLWLIERLIRMIQDGAGFDPQVVVRGIHGQ